MHFLPSIALTWVTKQTDDLVENQFDADPDGRDGLGLSHQCNTDLGHLFCIVRTCKVPGKMFCEGHTQPDICTNAQPKCFLLVSVCSFFPALYCPLILTLSILKKKPKTIYFDSMISQTLWLRANLINLLCKG